jgi:hypothetical protein
VSTVWQLASASVPGSILSPIGLDRVCQKNAGANKRDDGHYQLDHRTHPSAFLRWSHCFNVVSSNWFHAGRGRRCSTRKDRQFRVVEPGRRERFARIWPKGDFVCGLMPRSGRADKLGIGSASPRMVQGEAVPASLMGVVIHHLNCGGWAGLLGNANGPERSRRRAPGPQPQR